MRGEDVCAEAERLVGRGVPDGDISGISFPRHTPLEVEDKNGGMDDGAAVNDKWDGTGCTGMARYPLPEIWPRSPRPP